MAGNVFFLQGKVGIMNGKIVLTGGHTIKAALCKSATEPTDPKSPATNITYYDVYDDATGKIVSNGTPGATVYGMLTSGDNYQGDVTLTTPAVGAVSTSAGYGIWTFADVTFPSIDAGVSVYGVMIYDLQSTTTAKQLICYCSFGAQKVTGGGDFIVKFGTLSTGVITIGS